MPDHARNRIKRRNVPNSTLDLKLFSGCLDKRKDQLNPTLSSCRVSVNQYHLGKKISIYSSLWEGMSEEEKDFK